MIVSINPATGAEIARFDEHTAADIDAALSGAVRAQAS
jgi:succinate-semialdehyde dehydrogenase/glutarate-semialdehyde dehydrogenase